MLRCVCFILRAVPLMVRLPTHVCCMSSLCCRLVTQCSCVLGPGGLLPILCTARRQVMCPTHIARRPFLSSRDFMSMSSTCVISCCSNHQPPASQPGKPPSQGANTPNPGKASGSPAFAGVALGRVNPRTSKRLPERHTGSRQAKIK